MSPQPTNEHTIRHFSHHQLFYLAFLRIYVSISYKTVASHFNRCFDLRPPLTARDCGTIYLDLHDSEHSAWVRARDMNRQEAELLRTMMQNLGLARKRWDVDLIQPAGLTTCYRIARRNDGKAGVDPSN